MGRPRLLDLFCGAGGCAVGYDRAGFDVTGVDIKPQKNFPFEFVQGDALEYLAEHGHEYDAIHASPPCQRYSHATIVHGQKQRESHPDLVGPTRDLLEQIARPWVIENVMGAPVAGIMLCGLMFGLRVLRHRLFETSFYCMIPSHPKHPSGMLTNSHRAYDRGESRYVCVVGHNFSREEGERAMGIDWMQNRHELSQAIPPAYTYHVGLQLMGFIDNMKA